MAVRPLVINFGQSNSGPYHDIASWLPDRVDLNCLVSQNRVGGSLAPNFTMRFNAPGFTGTRPLKGQVLRNIRYLKFYNPIVTGYTSYPGTGRVTNLIGLTATFSYSSAYVWVEQEFLNGKFHVPSITRKSTNTKHVVAAVAERLMVFTTDFGTSTSNILLPGHGLKVGDKFTVFVSDNTLPNGIPDATNLFVKTVVDSDTFTVSTTSGGAAVTFSDDGTGVHTAVLEMPTGDSAFAGCRMQLHAVKATALTLSSVVTTATSATFDKVAHGLSNLEAVTLSGPLPPEFSPGVIYFVRNKTADDFELSETIDGDVIVSSTSGSAVVVTRLENAGVFSPDSTGEEEFTYTLLATDTESSEAEAQLSLNFGVHRQTAQAYLTGLQLRCVRTGDVRIMDEWNRGTRKTTLVNKVGLAPQTWSIVAGDELVIEPQDGRAFDRYCFFLPFSMFESDLSEAVIGKINPYMPGFDDQGDAHVPGLYGTDSRLPFSIPGTGGIFKRSHYPFGLGISWHVGFNVRMSEFLGKEVWCLSCDFGGTSATHIEAELGTPNCGWYDKAQQTDWSLGRPNGCFQRFLDELDAAIAAAALEGDTLEVVGVWRNQGFADATSGSDPTYGDTANQSGASADKFYEANKAFRARVRQELVDRGLWPRTAKEIPWVQPLEQEEAADLSTIGDITLLTQVNTALQRLADEDPYAETWDQTGLLTGPDGIHFLGSELAKVEEENFNAYFRILRSNDPQGEVDICNTALTHIGEAAVVTSITPPDGSAQAQHCALYYPIARNCILEAHAWNFATKRRPLKLVETNNTTAWAYAYFRPADALRVLSVVPYGASDDYSVPVPPVQDFHFGTTYPYPQSLNSAIVPVRYAQGVLGDGTQVIYTNEPNAEIRYTALMRDVTQFTEAARLAISWYLAALLAGVTVKGPAGSALQDRCMRMAQAYVTQAVRNDGNQQRVEPEQTAPWTQARS